MGVGGRRAQGGLEASPPSLLMTNTHSCTMTTLSCRNRHRQAPASAPRHSDHSRSTSAHRALFPGRDQQDHGTSPRCGAQRGIGNAPPGRLPAALRPTPATGPAISPSSLPLAFSATSPSLRQPGVATRTRRLRGELSHRNGRRGKGTLPECSSLVPDPAGPSRPPFTALPSHAGRPTRNPIQTRLL